MRSVASAVTAATPIAPPIWNDALTSPEAVPARSAGTSRIAAIVFGTPMNGIAKP